MATAVLEGASKRKPRAAKLSDREVCEAAGRKILRAKSGDEVVRESCGRCGGSGLHSYCQMYGDTCFQCGGRGTVLNTVAVVARRIKRQQAAERKAAKRAAEIEAFLGTRVWVTLEDVERAAYAESDRQLKARKARALAERQAKQQFVGVVGEKLEVEVQVDDLKEFPGAYGTRVLVRMHDRADNRLVWWTSWSSVPGEWVNDNGTWRTVRGTVKGHDEYKGDKQTTLTRVKEIGG